MGKLPEQLPRCQSAPIVIDSLELERQSDTIETEFQSAEPEVTMLVVPLEMMTTGEQGRIHALDGSPEFVIRLQEMGLREGVPVQMVRAGSPCILSVNDQRLSLRFEDSTTVLVELLKCTR